MRVHSILLILFTTVIKVPQQAINKGEICACFDIILFKVCDCLAQMLHLKICIFLIRA